MLKDGEVELVIGIGGQVSPLRIVSVKLKIKDYEGHNHQETFNWVYYSPQYLKMPFNTQKLLDWGI